MGFEIWGLSDLLRRFTGLAIRPAPGTTIRLAGELEFRASAGNLEEIHDRYDITMEVPEEFPRQLPLVFEHGGRIPKSFHKLREGALCLGSDFRQFAVLVKRPTLLGFVEGCVIPYLYGFSYFIKHGTMPLGELDHGFKGLIDDYRRAFRVRTTAACLDMLRLLGMKKRIANKHPCPCGSGRRLGRCHNRVLNPLRTFQSRQWYLQQRQLFLDAGLK